MKRLLAIVSAFAVLAALASAPAGAAGGYTITDIGTPAVPRLSRRRLSRPGLVAARDALSQLACSSATESASSRMPIPSSSSSRVIVSGGTTMITFQCVIR
jgi:hypothetical protein